MLQDWEAGMVGNNPGTTARLPRVATSATLPRVATSARVVINLMRGRLAPRPMRHELPSAA